MRPLFKTLEAVAIGTSQYYGDLNLTPLIARPDMLPTCPTYKSLDEALSEGTIVISEVSETGSVPNLYADNSGDDPVLILDGEELVGAKQNRIANVTMLLPAQTKTIIPVSCVEAGRWSYRRRHFSSAGHTHFLSGRAGKAASVSASLKRQMSRQGDQRQVWSDIHRVMSGLKVRSSTASIHQAYHARADQLIDYQQAFVVAPDQVGIIYGLHGVVHGLDLFGSPEIFKRAFPKLIRGAALQASGGSSVSETDQHQLASFWTAVMRTNHDQYRAVGLGNEYRIASPGLSGSALIVDDRLVHLYAFPSR